MDDNITMNEIIIKLLKAPENKEGLKALNEAVDVYRQSLVDGSQTSTLVPRKESQEARDMMARVREAKRLKHNQRQREARARRLNEVRAKRSLELQPTVVLVNDMPPTHPVIMDPVETPVAPKRRPAVTISELLNAAQSLESECDSECETTIEDE